MSAPSLRSFALQDNESHMPDGTLKLFDNHTPCLERLSLSCVRWLPTNAFANLTFLAIKSCIIPKFCAKLRSLLAGTPNLVDLGLRCVTDGADGYKHHEPTDTKPVSLARLRRLLIQHMWVDDIDYVFRDARLNEDVSVSIKKMITHYGHGRQILELVSTWSLNALKQSKEPHLQPHVAIVAGASSGFRFAVERRTTPEDWTTFDELWMLSLSSISHLCTFEWDACHGVFSLERVRNLLRQMTALETLSVNIEGLTSVVDALTLFRDPIDPPLCPALTTLRIAIRKDSDCNIVLDSVHSHRAQLGIKHLYIGLVNPENGHWTPRQTVKDQLQGNFESVKFGTLSYDKAYGITLPLVCDEEVHRLWPPWL
ncbi:uncharacterized protein LAESUDRAFT_814869 [Laetiporus sulphureus 93-53]|uniref:F-box domain-containing protein n=1 Tax=Laetiporus sulphureus 93-53 TaxID=1314785 RepID=A0A165CLA5_9APHY|nr:uncharacterized protein LAESUDRAFT_814869 [Laetiporus sulphureus 93-53]KZT03013.1 hypothetical protein LAESUDRAFT_814869 [Laetiporus sulphureus 93-53]